MAMFSLANAAGAAFRAALNTVLGKLHGNYYGSTDPSAAAESTPGMLWVDTSGGTPALKARNAADTGWITLGALDPAAFQLAGTSAFGRSLIDDASSTIAHGTLGTLAFLGNKVPTGATDLGASADLNTITTPGFYQQPLTVNAISGSNYPVAQAGALAVYETGAKNGGVGAGVAQVYTQFWRVADGKARTFFRSEYNNTWSPWHEIAAAPVGTSFACRAWVNFNGTGTPSIRASGNVSSITDLGTGNYRVNFTNAMPDTNYAVAVTSESISKLDGGSAQTTTGVTITTHVFSSTSVAQGDNERVNVAIFR